MIEKHESYRQQIKTSVVENPEGAEKISKSFNQKLKRFEGSSTSGQCNASFTGL